MLHVLVHHNENGANNNEIAELVCLNAAVLEGKDYFGRTPIHLLLSENHNVSIDAIDQLLSETNLYLVDNQGATLLHTACYSENFPAVDYLVIKGLS
ncbi:ankyrin repeat domain-containing protein [Legionella sainthelensi]|uniref:ankyrin repeat domain-containing protein n=1 Tax=Legionella sainthelensi TaxID=28087 RepID=UPI000E2046CE